MTRAVVLVVVCLFALAGAVGFAGAIAEQPASATSASQELPEQIGVEEPTQTDTATAHVHAGAVTDTGTTATEVRLREIHLTDELADATTSHERGNILEPTIEDLEADLQDLRAADQAAIEQYADGELTVQELVEQLVKTTIAAEEYERLLGLIEQEVQTVDDLDTTDELEAARADLSVLQSETRTHLVELASAERDAQEIQITAAETGYGYRIGLITEGTYWLDTYYAEHRDRASDNASLSFDMVQQRYGELYPSLSDDIFSVVERTDHGVYEVQSSAGFVNEHRVLLDGRTEMAFFEHHSWDLETAPTEPLVNVTDDGLTVEIRGTMPGGPATVEVTDAETGTPVETTLEFDGRTVTGTGTQTFVAPATSTSINVTADDRHLTVATDWDGQ